MPILSAYVDSIIYCCNSIILFFFSLKHILIYFFSFLHNLINVKKRGS